MSISGVRMTMSHDDHAISPGVFEGSPTNR
jgi:hypothetical protein